jgi:hypothetical protein
MDTPQGRSDYKELLNALEGKLPAEYIADMVTLRTGQKSGGGMTGSDAIGAIGIDEMAASVIKGYESTNRESRIARTLEWMQANPEKLEPDEFRALVERTLYTNKEARDAAQGKRVRLVDVSTLSVGQKFKIAGDEFEVKAIDPDTGEVTLEDGVPVIMPPHGEVLIDNKTLTKPPAGQEEGDTSFDTSTMNQRQGRTVQTNLLGEAEPEAPTTGDQKGLEFGADTEGNQPSPSGWVTPEGRLRQGKDTDSEEKARIKAAEDKLKKDSEENDQGLMFVSEEEDEQDLPEEAEMTGTANRLGPGEVKAGNQTAPLPGRAKAPVPPQEIVQGWSKVFGVTLTTGGYRGRALGQYQTKPEVIRTRNSFSSSLGTISHEVAHHIDKTYRPRKGIKRKMQTELAGMDYDPKQRRTFEGFAEFIRKWLTENEVGESKKRAPLFYDYFFNTFLPAHPDLQKKLNDARERVEEYRRQDPKQAMEAAISWDGKKFSGRSVRDRLARALNRLSRWWYDSQGIVLQMVKAGDRKKALRPGEDPYKWMQVLTHASAAMARDAIDDGVWSLETGNRIGPAVRDAFEVLNYDGKLDKQRLKDWTMYLAARHAREMWAQDRNPGVEERYAEAYYQGHKNDPGFEQAAVLFTEFHKALVVMVAEVGRLDGESLKNILQAFPAYVPMQRVLEDERVSSSTGGGRGVANARNPVRRMSEEGSGAQIIDPLAVTMSMAESFYLAAAQTMAARRVVEYAESREGMGDYVSPVDPPQDVMQTELGNLASQLKDAGVDLTGIDLTTMLTIARASNVYNGDKPYIVIYKGGKPKWYRVHPDLWYALKDIAPYQLPAGIESTLPGKAMVGATKLKRLGATELRPSFGLLINPSRDFFTYAIRTQGNSATAPFRLLKSFAHEMMNGWLKATGRGEDPMIRLYNQYGGYMAGFIGQDYAKSKDVAGDLMNDVRNQGWKNYLKHPVELLRNIFSVFEKTPRLAEFEMILKRNGYTRADLNAGRTPPPGLIVEAMYAGASVTTNFKRAGAAGRVLNKISAYSNAKIQDIVDDWRVAQAHPGRTLLRGTLWLTLPSLFLWLMNKDEDWYRELPAWRKLAGWNPTKGVFIPSPFMLGMVFAHLPIAALDSSYRKDPTAINDWLGQLGDEYGMSGDPKKMVNNVVRFAMPDLLEPAMEAYVAEADWRNKPIETQAQKGLPPDQRFTERTTPAAKYFGWLFNQSPMKIDHMIGGHFPLGRDILNITQQGISKALGTSRVTPYSRARSIDDFYQAVTKAEEDYNGARQKKLMGGPEVSQEVADRQFELTKYADLMASLRNARTAAGDDEAMKQSIDAYMGGLSRAALGREELGDYPNPLRDRMAPEPVRKAVDEFLGARLDQLTDPGPAKRKPGETEEEWDARDQAAAKNAKRAEPFIRSANLDDDYVWELIQARGLKMGLRSSSFGARYQRYLAWKRGE